MSGDDPEASYRENPIKSFRCCWNPIQLANRSKTGRINRSSDGVRRVGDDVRFAPVLITHSQFAIDGGGGVGFVESAPTDPRSADQN